MDNLTENYNYKHNNSLDAVSLPPFPTEVFSKPIQNMIQFQAEVNQTYPDIPGIPALYICSVSLKAKFEINVRMVG